MTPADIAELIAMLKTRWPRSTWAADPVLEVKMWHMAIGDIPLEHVLRVLPGLTQRSEFPPDPSRIRSAVASASGMIPEPGAAWGSVQEWLRGSVEFADLPAPIKQAVKDIGGTYNVRQSAKPENDRRAFIDAYGVRRDEAITSADFGAMIGAGCAALGAG